jgi:hypothetical protein
LSNAKRIVDAARAVARNRAVQGAAAAAAARLAAGAEPALRERYDRWSGARADRMLAIRLARQIQGRYSEHTIIAGRPHHVVWKDGVPIEAFPPVEDLELRPELRDFDDRLTKAPPPERRLPSLMKR